MKKILSLVLVVVMMMSMTVTAFAAGEQSGTTTVTAVVPEPVPEYTIHIPADMTLEYGNGGYQKVGEVYVSGAKNIKEENEIVVDISATELVNTTDASKKIPVNYYTNDTDAIGPYISINSSTQSVYAVGFYVKFGLWAEVTAEAWNAAKPGTYTSTITYNFEIK